VTVRAHQGFSRGVCVAERAQLRQNQPDRQNQPVARLVRDAQDRRIVALAIPALGTLAVEPLYVLADTAIVGHLGTTPLAGLALASSVLLLVTAGCNFLAYATTQRFAHHRGGGRPADAARVGVQALWLSAVLGVPLAAVLAAGARLFAWVLGGRGDVLDAATTYLRISAVGIPFILVALAGQGVLRGVQDLGTAFRIVVLANVANVALELLAVYGLDLGIAGSAWSTVVVQAGAAVAFLVVVRPHLAAAASRRIDRREMAPFLTAGGHLALRVATVLIVVTGSTFVAAHIDDATLAAHQIGATLFSLLALALDAYAIPAQTLVANALGAGYPVEAVEIGDRVLRLSILTATALGLVLAALSWPLTHVFTSDPAVASRAGVAILFLALMLPPGGVAWALDGVLMGAGDYRFLGRASAVSALAYLPLAVVTLAVPSLGIAGVWLSMVVWMVARAAVNERRYRSGRWTNATV
jgi:putative MATE family efflux protein